MDLRTDGGSESRHETEYLESQSIDVLRITSHTPEYNCCGPHRSVKLFQCYATLWPSAEWLRVDAKSKYLDAERSWIYS